MLQTIRGKYEKGHIVLDEKLPLVEGSEITATIIATEAEAAGTAAERFIAAAGTWETLVDEDIIDELYAQRRLKTRSTVSL